MTATREDRRIALVAGGLFAAFFTLCFAFQVGSWSVGTVSDVHQRVVPGPIGTLTIDAGDADVHVVPGSGPDLTLVTRAEAAFHVPRLDVVVTGSHVSLDGGCRGAHFGRCRASLEVRLPAGTGLRVQAGRSDLSASDLTGDVDLETASGDVQADGLSGPVRLTTHSGDIVASRLSGPRARLSADSGDVFAADASVPRFAASTQSGDVSLEFAQSPTAVSATASSGDVDVVVPGGAAYVVDAETDSGSRDVAVPTSAGSDRTIRVRTSSGDVAVEPR